MCGRYYIAEEDQAEELRQIIDMICRKHNGDGSVKTAGEIFPSEKVPVITTSRAQKIIPFPMEWGYSTSDGNRLINARSETASQKPTFKDGMLHRRCIIPASWYFEWNRNEPGRPKDVCTFLAFHFLFRRASTSIRKWIPCQTTICIFSLLTKATA